jgi:hypothetical protein
MLFSMLLEDITIDSVEKRKEVKQKKAVLRR